MELAVGSILTQKIQDVHGELVSGTIEKIYKNVVIVVANTNEVPGGTGIERYVIKKNSLQKKGYIIWATSSRCGSFFIKLVVSLK